jgi:hypothetical protein
MAMNYADLVADKSTAGSIANWFNYSRLDLPNVLEEAQKLLYQHLRVREMRSAWTFGLKEGRSRIALPSDFLDPSGVMLCPSKYLKPTLKPQSYVEEARTWEEFTAATLGADPFTATSGSRNVVVADVGHDLTEGSIITFYDSTAVGGLDLNDNGFPIIALPDDDSFTIDAQSAASSSGAGGGSGVTYDGSKLLAGYPDCWAIGDDGYVMFDVAMNELMRFRLPCYRMPALLSASNSTNFLTTRYPHLLRAATMAKAANMQKDSDEYSKHMKELLLLIQDVQAKDDLSYYGAEIATDTP